MNPCTTFTKNLIKLLGERWYDTGFRSQLVKIESFQLWLLFSLMFFASISIIIPFLGMKYLLPKNQILPFKFGQFSQIQFHEKFLQ